ncbi:MAG TPA: AI-2E family transporter [Longimicrobiaceae bacterium]
MTAAGTDGDALRARVLLAALGVAVLVGIAPFAVGLVGGAVLYVLCAPVQRRLEHVLGQRKAAGLVVVCATVLVLLPGAWLLATLLGEAPAMLHGVRESRLFARLAEVRVGPLDLGAQLAREWGALLSWASRQALGLFGSATRGVVNLLIALFTAYYLLVSPGRAWSRAVAYLPFSGATAERLLARFRSLTEATLIGVSLTAFVQGSVVGLGFWATGLPGPLFWGGVTALVSVLPVLGSALVWLPGVAVLLAGGRYGAAAGLALLGGVVASNADNVLWPVVFRRVSGIHPLVTLVGAFAGIRYFGLPGVLLGPLAITCFFELMEVYREEYGRSDRPGPPPSP